MNKSDIDKIIASLKAGDVSVLETIYEENRIAFLNFSKKFNVPKQDAVDVYQDAIIAMRDNLVGGKVKHLNSSLKTYLFSIGKFMIYKRFNTSIKTHELNEVESLDGLTYFIDNYEENKGMEQQLVNRCLPHLGQRCYEVLKLFYYDGLTLEEIQQYLGYNNYNVIKSQKSRCLKHLKELINKQRQNG